MASQDISSRIAENAPRVSRKNLKPLLLHRNTSGVTPAFRISDSITLLAVASAAGEERRPFIFGGGSEVKMRSKLSPRNAAAESRGSYLCVFANALARSDSSFISPVFSIERSAVPFARLNSVGFPTIPCPMPPA